jgi:hypothetical protein
VGSSSPTLAQSNPTRELEAVWGHPAPAQTISEAQATSRGPEEAFDRLNPECGVPADPRNRSGQQAIQDREAALALGTRVAVATSRENDPNPVLWLAGQDYRAADAIHRARAQTIRQRHGPERLGPER